MQNNALCQSNFLKYVHFSVQCTDTTATVKKVPTPYGVNVRIHNAYTTD